MQSTIEVLKSRRSVKNFSQKPVSKADLSSILDAAVNAPSGMNVQSPKILVLQRKDIIKRFSEWNKSFYPKEILDNLPDDFDPFYNASTLIIVLADKNVNTCVEDASLVIGNILNAASSIGLGACWIHRAREEFDSLQGKELLKVWNLSLDYIGVGHVVLGYPSDDFVVSDKKIKEDYVVYLDDII
ncbi:MAG: diguanylate cyclase [Methanosphaera sp. rholeuAM270]|nr:MAG: diguanylate cyclase [Methanosphaera sp. rholeuAM270]